MICGRSSPESCDTFGTYRCPCGEAVQDSEELLSDGYPLGQGDMRYPYGWPPAPLHSTVDNRN